MHCHEAFRGEGRQENGTAALVRGQEKRHHHLEIGIYHRWEETVAVEEAAVGVEGTVAEVKVSMVVCEVHDRPCQDHPIQMPRSQQKEQGVASR